MLFVSLGAAPVTDHAAETDIDSDVGFCFFLSIALSVGEVTPKHLPRRSSNFYLRLAILTWHHGCNHQMMREASTRESISLLIDLKEPDPKPVCLYRRRPVFFLWAAPIHREPKKQPFGLSPLRFGALPTDRQNSGLGFICQQGDWLPI
jgi:hypothetical protein